jgi:hypothetical protein
LFNERVFPGDIVEVKTPAEILQTLDDDGSLDYMPFMPEMVEFCGRRFRVSKRAIKTCLSGLGPSTMRMFKSDDVLLLEGLRCSGALHDGCQKSCMILWREAWLRKVTDVTDETRVNPGGCQRLRSRLKTTAAKSYFCQASELLKTTVPMSRWKRLGACFTDIHQGNCSASEMVKRIGIWLFWRIRRQLMGEYAHGKKKITPAESLNLQPGESIEVKSMENIKDTLDEQGHNRGLYFSPDMHLLCGRRCLVRNRIDKLIVDGTGEMRKLHNTVYLEGSLCGCSHVAFGGCPRGEFVYWREIWLRRM